MYNVELPPSVPCAPLRNVGTPPRETANEKPLGISWPVPRPHLQKPHCKTHSTRRDLNEPPRHRTPKCAALRETRRRGRGRFWKRTSETPTDPPPLPPPQSRSPAGHMLQSTRPPARREQQRPSPAEHMLLSTRPPARPVRCMTHSAKANSRRPAALPDKCAEHVSSS